MSSDETFNPYASPTSTEVLTIPGGPVRFERRMGGAATVFLGTFAGIGIGAMASSVGAALLGLLVGIAVAPEAVLSLAMAGGVFGGLVGSVVGVVPGLVASAVHANLNQPSEKARLAVTVSCGIIGALVGVWGGYLVSGIHNASRMLEICFGVASGAGSGAVGGYFLDRAIRNIAWREIPQSARTSATDIDSSASFENTSG
ncbi:MAG: hypothetical protein JSS27_20630 [Planctomycetes bacterium]|nr:hypothetical protein [Planctomycetota bacterium]